MEGWQCGVTSGRSHFSWLLPFLVWPPVRPVCANVLVDACRMWKCLLAGLLAVVGGLHGEATRTQNQAIAARCVGDARSWSAAGWMVESRSDGAASSGGARSQDLFISNMWCQIHVFLLVFYFFYNSWLYIKDFSKNCMVSWPHSYQRGSATGRLVYMYVRCHYPIKGSLYAHGH